MCQPYSYARVWDELAYQLNNEGTRIAHGDRSIEVISVNWGIQEFYLGDVECAFGIHEVCRGLETVTLSRTFSMTCLTCDIIAYNDIVSLFSW